MTLFTNPTNSQDDVYINKDLREEISHSSSVYEELKFRPERVLDFVEDCDPSNYTSVPEPYEFSEYDQELATEVDSFTAPEIIENIIYNSEIIGVEADPTEGLFHINTYKTAEIDGGWTFWIPFVDDVKGEIIGQVEDPYTQNVRSFSHSVEEPMSTEACRDSDIGDAVYALARETIPEGPEVQPTKSQGRVIDEQYLIGQFDIFEENAGIISQLEESGQHQIGENEYSTSNGMRGGSITIGVRNFFNLLKDARVIDYTVSNDNKENILEIENGGYKTITRDIPRLGFSSPQELIASRTAPKWKNKD